MFLSAAPRRLLYFTLVLLTTLGGAYLMADIVRANGASVLEIAILILFTITFTLVAAAFWTAIIGFLIRLLARDPIVFTAPIAEVSNFDPITTRIAVIMPVYNEDTKRVFAGLEATFRSLRASGEAMHFQFFVLSDTTDPIIAATEERCYAELCTKLDADNICYRRRTENKGRKVGNIDDFLQRWGRQFDFMIVLDADSVMSGPSLLRLTRMMQARPQAGIIQTVPLPVHQETLFARTIQFGSRLCSELLNTGQSFWLQDAGNYYGHNAILRISAFIEHARLPRLPGKGPLSGDILSHDFVEAAWLRRAGWEIWNLPDGSGSYEEMPSNILDYVKRDRRWCQGNLQHLRLLATPGLHWISRIHFLRGILAFVSSPLWLLLLLLTIAQIFDQTSTDIVYFPADYQLFPVWPVFKTTEAISLFVVTVIMLLTPRLLALLLVLASPRQRRRFGGSARAVLSVVLEILLSMLLAPIMMVFHSLFILSILSGKAVGWNPQARGSRGLSFREAFKAHIMQLLLGVAMGGFILSVAPGFIWWLVPVLAGLLLAAPLAVLCSRVDIGLRLRRWRLLATPEEVYAPLELQTVQRRLDSAETIADTDTQRELWTPYPHSL